MPNDLPADLLAFRAQGRATLEARAAARAQKAIDERALLQARLTDAVLAVLPEPVLPFVEQHWLRKDWQPELACSVAIAIPGHHVIRTKFRRDGDAWVRVPYQAAVTPLDNPGGLSSWMVAANSPTFWEDLSCAVAYAQEMRAPLPGEEKWTPGQ